MEDLKAGIREDYWTIISGMMTATFSKKLLGRFESWVVMDEVTLNN